jgi:hypothetical protein
MEMAQSRQASTRRKRLGVGDYSRSSSDLLSFFARKVFIDHLEIEAPEVRETLRSLLQFPEGADRDAEIDRWASVHGLLWNGKPATVDKADGADDTPLVVKLAKRHWMVSSASR